MEVLKRILIERQTPDLVFEYDDLQNILLGMSNPIDTLNIITVLFDLESYILEKEKKKISEDTPFKKLPLSKTPILIDDIKMKILEDQRNKRKRGATLSIMEEKIVQEITFVDNFFHTAKGKEISQLYPNTALLKKKKQKKKKNQDDQEEDEIELDVNRNPQVEIRQQDENRNLSQEEKDENQMKMVRIIHYSNHRLVQLFT